MFYPYSELKKKNSRVFQSRKGNKTYKVKNIKGFVIQNLDEVFEDEMLYLDVWKNLIDKLSRVEKFHKNFEICFSCRTSISDNSLIDVFYKLIKFTEESEKFCEGILSFSENNHNNRKQLKIVPIRQYLTRHSSVRDYESVETYKKEFSKLPSYHSRHLFYSHKWISYTEDELNPHFIYSE